MNQINENEKDKRVNMRKPAIIIGIVSMIVILLLSIRFCGRKETGVYLSGLVSDGNRKSEVYTDLFYKQNGRYMINLDKLDDCISEDVVGIDNLYTVVTTLNQFCIDMNNQTYTLNQDVLSNDGWLVPTVLKNNTPYADINAIFESLGYVVEYNESSDGSVIEAVLKRDENASQYEYSEISVRNEFEDVDNVKETQAEENAVQKNPEENHAKPENAETPETVPFVPSVEKTEPSSELNESVPESDSAEDGETETVENQETTAVETESKPEEETLIHVEVPPVETEPAKSDPDNVKSDEEYENIWNETEKELTDIYNNSISNSGQDAFGQVTDNFICFNRAEGPIYQNTVSVLHDPISGEFLYAEFNGDWSDQANNVAHPESKAYYANIENVYLQTFKTLLGDVTGQALFDYIKPLADRTLQGGYIGQYNEEGSIESVWTDGPVGDGIKASQIDFSEWIDKRTDDGLRFRVVQYGDGMKIQVFYD